MGPSIAAGATTSGIYPVAKEVVQEDVVDKGTNTIQWQLRPHPKREARE